MTKYKPLTTAHWYIQKLERKADQFDAIMSKKIKSFLTKVSENTLWETLGGNDFVGNVSQEGTAMEGNAFALGNVNLIVSFPSD